jgi:dUTP pyrophosphatase
MKVAIRRMSGAEDIPLPKYMTEGSVGMDLYAAVDGGAIIKPGEIKLIPTGISVAIPPGYEAQIRPRSGLSLKGIGIVNSPGTIDSDYRDEVKVILINLGADAMAIKRGDRIAQMVVNKVERVEWDLVDRLPPTERKGGFGSTG